MIRLLASSILLAVLLLALVHREDFELGSGLQPATTGEVTPSTIWPQTMPTLPSGFDPARLAPKPRTKSKRPLLIASSSVWDQLAECESHGNWSINTGNGYSGGVQFHPRTWLNYGGAEFAPEAWQATREEQIVVAERVLAGEGWGAWPHCSRALGLR